MPQEIERKFLVSGDGWKALTQSRTPIRQGYIARGDGCTVRIREAGDKAFVTIKSTERGMVRDEYEYPIPPDHARQLLTDFGGKAVLEKTRHIAPVGGVNWEVDVFHGAHDGLVLAECEMTSADQHIDTPDWIGEEVTDDPKYSNENLARALAG